jgi:hypothetical protein
MAGVLEPFHHPGILLIRKSFRPRHDPDVSSVRHSDDGGLVVWREIADQKGRLERPNKLHAPLGVGFPIVDESPRPIGFQRAVETALVEGERSRDGAIRRERVILNRIVSLGFNESWDVSDDIPVAHEFFQIHFSGDGLQGRQIRRR